MVSVMAMGRCGIAGVILVLCLSIAPASRAADPERYLVVNIIPGENHRAIFEDVHRTVGLPVPGRPAIGIAAIFSYLDASRDSVQRDLLLFLALAEEFDIPVVVQLDGEQWWRARPDLWNWWDPSRPGYDPANASNVEWTGWGSEHAMKIAWRNWGRQIRVLPPPNFMSPAYRAACHEDMRALVPLVVSWWRHLPLSRRHLLIGVKLGWESAIGVNSFFLPGGNGLLDSAESRDPQIELQAASVPDRGVVAIGYAAVFTSGLATGGVLHEAHLAEVVRRHLEDLCALAGVLGIPRERLFTHVGGWKEDELLYRAAYNAHSCPGWSFYRHAADARGDVGVHHVLAESDAPYWAAAEWLLMGEHAAQEWRVAIMRALDVPRCRYLCVYNWTGIRGDSAAVRGIRAVVTGRE